MSLFGNIFSGKAGASPGAGGLFSSKSAFKVELPAATTTAPAETTQPSKKKKDKQNAPDSADDGVAANNAKPSGNGGAPSKHTSGAPAVKGEQTGADGAAGGKRARKAGDDQGIVVGTSGKGKQGSKAADATPDDDAAPQPVAKKQRKEAAANGAAGERQQPGAVASAAVKAAVKASRAVEQAKADAAAAPAGAVGLDAAHMGKQHGHKGEQRAGKAKRAAAAANEEERPFAAAVAAGGARKGVAAAAAAAGGTAAVPKAAAAGIAKKRSRKQLSDKDSSDEELPAVDPARGGEGAAGAGSDSGDGAEEGDCAGTDGAAGDAPGAGAGGAAKPEKKRLSPEEEAEKLRRTVFVGNLPPSITRKALKRIFAGYGAVDSARLRSVPVKMDAKMARKAAILTGKVDTERGPATAYVVFKDGAGAKAALAANMHVVEGNHIRVDAAAQPSSKKKALGAAAAAAGGGAASADDAAGASTVYDTARSVFVGNLHFQIKDEELISFLLEQPGLEDAVEAVRIVRDKANNVGKGFAFVLFKTKFPSAVTPPQAPGQIGLQRPAMPQQAQPPAPAGASGNLMQPPARPGPPPGAAPAGFGLSPPPPRPLNAAPPPALTRPGMPGQAGQALQAMRPRPDLLAAQPPTGAPTTASPGGMAPGANPELIRPNPPSLRVLEPLMPPAGQGGKPRIQVEVVEDEDGVVVPDEDAEFMARSGGKGKAVKGKGTRRKEKVTAEMRRDARKLREAQRQEKEAGNKRDKEEIFEVGEEGLSLEELAGMLVVDPSDIVRVLFMKGISLSMNQNLDRNIVKVVAAEYDVLVVDRDPASSLAKKRTEFTSDEDVDFLEARPPVVTVMGHVDHGKTSLLDHIRKARVAAGEAGGITQAIGAYNTEVEVDGEIKTICFLDTPGHEAFSAMRARGAQVTDIAIIIVAADDGVRPQTREAVAHAQAAAVPIVVAINKIDKPGADVERVKQELLELNLVPEEWGGSTPMVAVSAKKGVGIPDLLTQLLWVAEEKQLVANPTKPAQGTVIEAHLDKKRGPVATLLVQSGTLRAGDTVRAGASYGKARQLQNDLGQNISSAGPSIAVQLIGLNSVPVAGEEFGVYPTEQAARLAAADFEDALKERRMADLRGGGSMVTLSSLATVDEDQEAMQRLNIIIKADTAGMVEAIKSALSMLPQESVGLRFLLSAAGDITVTDVDLAAASGALMLAFNLEADESASSHAKRLGVSVKSYRIIYELIDDVKAAMEGKLRIVEERVPTGTAVVKAVFGNGKRRVAGCAVTDGKLVKADGFVTVKRGKSVVYDGKINSLRRVKDNVEEVAYGLECGLGCDAFWEWAEGDVLECYRLVSKSRRLEDARATKAVDMATLDN